MCIEEKGGDKEDDKGPQQKGKGTFKEFGVRSILILTPLSSRVHQQLSLPIPVVTCYSPPSPALLTSLW